MLFSLFTMYEKECLRLIDEKLVLPAYDYCLKCSHTFNLLDARGAISVTERAAYIGRVRALAHECAQGYLDSREALGFPLLPTRDRAPVVYWARLAYNILIPGVVGGMVLFVGSDFVRRRIERRRSKDHPVTHA